MIRFVLRTVWSLFVLGTIAYCTFFVPLGSRTLFEHVVRIARTDEARDLGDEVGQATTRAGDAIAEKVRQASETDAATEGSVAEATPAPAARSGLDAP